MAKPGAKTREIDYLHVLMLSQTSRNAFPSRKTISQQNQWFILVSSSWHGGRRGLSVWKRRCSIKVQRFL